MGMDLIGFLVVGPAHLEEGKREEAKRHLQDLREKVESVQANLGEEDYPEDYPDFLPKFSGDLETDWDDLQDALENKSLVEDLFAVWEDGARDAACRIHPGDESQAILFAGEGSWGQEPEGWGYTTLKHAYYLGLWEIVGIR